MRETAARIVPRTFAAGVAGVVGSYAVAGFTPEFVAAPIDRLLATTMPGAVVTFAIQTFGSLGQRLNFLLALVLAAALLGSAAAIAIEIGWRVDRPVIAVGLAGLLAWLVVWSLTGSPASALAAAAGVAVVVAAGAVGIPDGERGFSMARRRTLAALAGVAGFSALAVAASDRQSRPSPAGEPAGDGDGRALFSDQEREQIDGLLVEGREKSLDVAGIEPLVSEQFYEVDISSVNPTLGAGEWELRIHGAVDSERTITYDDLLGMEREHRFVTLRCVGESLNGQKMDNALWTGVPVAELLDFEELAGCCVMFRAADDFYEEFPIEALRGAFLAFGMNGEPLPRGHGYPVRALVPGHWGEINVKWLTEIEILETEIDGYWEKRGWHGTGPVNTVAKIHAVNHLDGTIQVGGHAYAGTRGIERVEVSTDGGQTWQDATLNDPLPGEDVWRQWRFEYDSPNGRHEVVARATDGEGNLQAREESRSFPSGPTGWVSRSVRP